MATPTPGKPTIKAVPSTEGDIEQLVDWLYNVMERNDPVMEPIFTDPELAFKDVPTTREIFTDPSHMTFKAVVVGGGGEGSDRMIGFITTWLATANWVEEEAVATPRKASPLIYRYGTPQWRGADPEMLSQFFGQIGDSRSEVLGGKKHIYIQFVCVEPTHQRKGVGEKLMERVLQIAGEENVPVYLDSTHAGRRLYRRVGFEVAKTLKLKTADGRVIEFPSMIKHVQ